ncbi:MAG: hypothetical protein FWE16_05340 [Firmicutes bacterium]|nr:hypothetical protein [Bacillota bacterium]
MVGAIIGGTIGFLILAIIVVNVIVFRRMAGHARADENRIRNMVQNFDSNKFYARFAYQLELESNGEIKRTYRIVQGTRSRGGPIMAGTGVHTRRIRTDGLEGSVVFVDNKFIFVTKDTDNILEIRITNKWQIEKLDEETEFVIRDAEQKSYYFRFLLSSHLERLLNQLPL